MNNKTGSCENKNKLPVCYWKNFHIPSDIKARTKNKFWKVLWQFVEKMSPMCCIRLYLSCVGPCSQTLWTIATSRLYWTEVTENDKMIKTTAEQKTCCPWWSFNGGQQSHLVQVLLAGVCLPAGASQTAQTAWRTKLWPSVCLCLSVLFLCLMRGGGEIIHDPRDKGLFPPPPLHFVPRVKCLSLVLEILGHKKRICCVR